MSLDTRGGVRTAGESAATATTVSGEPVRKRILVTAVLAVATTAYFAPAAPTQGDGGGPEIPPVAGSLLVGLSALGIIDTMRRMRQAR